MILCYELSEQEALTLHQDKAHDVRVFTASKAFQSGVSLEQIFSAYHWKSHNIFTQCPSPHVAFSLVKALVPHGLPAGSLSQAPILLSAVPSSQAALVSGPDGTCVTAAATTTSVGMTSLLENLYPDTDATEPVFAQPSLVSYGDPVSHSIPVSSVSYVPPEPAEEGELSDLEDQPDVDAGDSDRVLSEDQNYRETVRGVRVFMGWTHIPNLEYSPASRTDNPMNGP